MPTCLEWATERHEECVEWRDDGYEGCDAWDSRCCDWWPCSWACKVVTWFCVAWVWVSNLVCVAWNVITTTFCVVWDVVTTVINAILVTLESIAGWILSAGAALVELIFAIPWVGGALRWLWSLVLFIFWTLVSQLDVVLGFLGVRPEKKLRICTIILRDESANPVASVPYVVDQLQWAADILKREANIRLVPLAPFQYHTGFAPAETVDESWVQDNGGASGPGILDVPCNAAGFAADLGLAGSALVLTTTRRCFFGNWRRVVGYGSPVACFIIRSVPTDGDSDCGSFGCGLWITDYVTVRNQPCGSAQVINRRVTAHELGHVGNLWHLNAESHQTNLMGVPWNGNDPPEQTRLAGWQIVLLRSSKHVTYF